MKQRPEITERKAATILSNGWAGRQEKIRPQESCFFLTPFIELIRTWYRPQSARGALHSDELFHRSEFLRHLRSRSSTAPVLCPHKAPKALSGFTAVRPGPNTPSSADPVPCAAQTCRKPATLGFSSRFSEILLACLSSHTFAGVHRMFLADHFRHPRVACAAKCAATSFVDSYTANSPPKRLVFRIQSHASTSSRPQFLHSAFCGMLPLLPFVGVYTCQIRILAALMRSLVASPPLAQLKYGFSRKAFVVLHPSDCVVQIFAHDTTALVFEGE